MATIEKERVFEATPSVGDLDAYLELLDHPDPTPSSTERPFYKPDAPFRAKVNPVASAGTPLVIAGTVIGLDTQAPQPNALIDVWQADSKGAYYGIDGDPGFDYRVRLVTDRKGRFELETVHPAPYEVPNRFWRAPHLHFLVQVPTYKTLVTQLFFEGDPRQDNDPFFDQRLMIPLQRTQGETGMVEVGRFDIALERAQ